MAELACNSEDCYVSTGEVSDKYNLPRPFLEKIMRQLRDAGLVEVKRGRAGGYELSAAPSNITVKDVILVLEEDSYAPVACLKENGAECPLSEDCPTAEVWGRIYRQMREVLEDFTLADFLQAVE